MLFRRLSQRTSVLALISVVLLGTGLAACLLWSVSAASNRQSDADAVPDTTTTVLASFAAMDLPMGIASAEAIIVGQVDGQQWTSRGVQMSEWGLERQRGLGYSDAEIEDLVGRFSGYVYTHSLFRVDRTLKGDFPDGEVEIWCTGGDFEGHRCEAPGFAQLHPGPQYILFIGRAFYGGYVPLAVYEVRDGRATSTSQGRNDDMTVEELLAIIDEHKDDPFPWVPTSQQELLNPPLDTENHPMIPEEERGIPSDTTTTVSP